MKSLSLVLCVLFWTTRASANIIFAGIAPDNSNAVQAQNSMMVVASNATTSSACVLIDSVLLGSNFVYTPCPSGFAGGDQTNVQTETFSAGSQNIANAADLRVTFDALESGGNSITIDRWVLYFWNPTTGAELVPGGIELSPVPYTINPTIQGGGNAEQVFKLDPQSIADLTLAGFNASTIIGMAVNLSNISGGPEAFYLSNQVTAEGVPEPGTYFLTIGALALLYRRVSSRRRTSLQATNSEGFSR
jgi:hypothetical protein